MNEILVKKLEFNKKPPFSATEHQIEKRIHVHKKNQGHMVKL